jgi:hypothetical protein
MLAAINLLGWGFIATHAVFAVEGSAEPAFNRQPPRNHEDMANTGQCQRHMQCQTRCSRAEEDVLGSSHHNEATDGDR